VHGVHYIARHALPKRHFRALESDLHPATWKQRTTSKQVGALIIHDTPGLLDSRGTQLDEWNIRDIVDTAKMRSHLHALVLVSLRRSHNFKERSRRGLSDCRY
jgi:hypothetical protein